MSETTDVVSAVATCVGATGTILAAAAAAYTAVQAKKVVSQAATALGYARRPELHLKMTFLEGADPTEGGALAQIMNSTVHEARSVSLTFVRVDGVGQAPPPYYAETLAAWTEPDQQPTLRVPLAALARTAGGREYRQVHVLDYVLGWNDPTGNVRFERRGTVTEMWTNLGMPGHDNFYQVVDPPSVVCPT